jgi:Leucine Rich repeat
MSNNQLGDRGLQYLADAIDYCNLEHLDLSKNQLTNVGVLDFAKSLQDNRSLVTINLRSNQIGKDGGLAIREAASIHKYLVGVYLEDNAVQVRDIEEIEKYMQRNREYRAQQRMPKYEQELNSLVKGRKKQELQETLLQLGLMNMAMSSLDLSR